MGAHCLHWLILSCFAFPLPRAAGAEHAAAPDRPEEKAPVLDGDVVLTDGNDRSRLSKALTIVQDYKAESPAFSKALQSVIAAPIVWHWTETNGCLNYRNEALALLDRTPAAWDAYEQMHGPAARALLEEGKKEGDRRKVRDVARRFAGTSAGLEAQSVLASYYVDRGQPLAAALLFEALFASKRFQRDEARALPPAERSRLAFDYLAAATAFHQTGKREARDRALQRARTLGSEDLAKRLLRDLREAPEAEPLARQRESFANGKEAARQQAYLDALNFHTQGTHAIAREVAEPPNPLLVVDGSDAAISRPGFLSGNAMLDCKFASVGWPLKLERVSARSLSLGAEKAGALLRSLSARAPLHLDLGDNALGDEGTKAIAEAPGSKSLTSLTLDWNGMSEAGVRALAGSPRLKGLTALTLTQNNVRDAGAKALAESPHLTRLTELDVRSNEIGPAGARSLAESANLKGLTSLSLAENPIEEDGAQAIAGSRHLEALRRLSLHDGKIGEDGARAIAISPHLKRLEYLGLNHNGIRDAGAKAIALSKGLSGLRHLHLAGNQLSDAGVDALARSTHLKSLVTLDVKRNILGDKGAGAIAGSANFKGLTELNLFDTRIGTAGAEAIAGSPNLKALTSINLGSNPINDAGVRALARSGILKSVTNLVLAHTGIGDRGAEFLANSPSMSSVTTLDISINDIGEAGMRALIRSPHLTRLTKLRWSDTTASEALRDDVDAFLRRNNGRKPPRP